MRAALLLQTALLMVLLGADAFAASPVDVFEFETPEQEQRYRVLIDELRCPKCMNVNIAGSDAPIAQDLRAVVHRMIVQEGRTNEEILTFMQDRYGDFVLYDPPFNRRTGWLWLLPLLVALAVAALLWRLVAGARIRQAQALTDREEAALREFLDESR